MAKQIILEDLSYEERMEYLKQRRQQREQKESFGTQNILSGEHVKYRCEQLNTTRIDDNFLTSTQQKIQFDVTFDSSRAMAKVQMEDYYIHITPSVMEKPFEFITPVEYIRNNVIFSIGQDGKIEEIKNIAEQRDKWNKFKKSKEFESDFIKAMSKDDEKRKALNLIIESGDKQFSDNFPAVNEYQARLFYSLLFNPYTANFCKNDQNISDITLLYQSSLDQTLKIPIKASSKMKKEDENFISLSVSGSPEITDENLQKIEKYYNEAYKPIIHYKFSKYILSYNILYQLNKKTKLIEEAKLDIIEGVEDNIVINCIFNLRKL